jgi:hypothetical protein
MLAREYLSVDVISIFPRYSSLKSYCWRCISEEDIPGSRQGPD